MSTVFEAIPRTLPAPTQPRMDLYGPIHKGLRLFMADTLSRVGSVDAADAADVHDTLAQLDALLGLMRSHLAHENAHVHPLLEARAAGSSLRIAGEHEEHVAALDALGAEAAALAAAPMPQRLLLAQRLYRHLALFVADNVQHMHIEETAHNQTLWAHCSDEDLMAAHGAILASIGPDEMDLALHWMAPALSHAELAGMLGGMQQEMPPEPFARLLRQVRPRLSVARWNKLSQALNLPQRPGLMQSN